MTGIDPRLAPKYVRREIRKISTYAPGHPVAITHPHGDVWRIVITSDRVRFASEYSRTQGKQDSNWWIGSTATIDGGEPVLVPFLQDVAHVFYDPDNYAPESTTPMPRNSRVDQAPAMVRECHQILQTGLVEPLQAREDPPEMAVRADLIGPDWVLGLDAERLSLRMRWIQRNGRWRPEGRGKFIELIVDGEDRSDEIDGDVDQAVKIIAPVLNQPRPKTIGKPSGPATQPTSVQVRKTIVLRN